MTVLSVDLAWKRHADIGVVLLRLAGRRVLVEPIRLAARGTADPPVAAELADCLAALAGERDASFLLIDGPQAWKSPHHGSAHARECERALATQGKTGLPGHTKPASYLGFIAFSIRLFDELAARGWPRLDRADLASGTLRRAVESFPTAAWRALGARPLAGKRRATAAAVASKLEELRTLFALRAPNELSHDELQALVAGLAGLALERGNPKGFVAVGAPAFPLDGAWREGLILNPTREAIA